MASDFKIYTGILKASRGADNRPRLRGIASSTVKDLHGDTMQLSALDDMQKAANENMTIYLNHSYAVPEDVFGSVENAAVSQRGEFYDLDLDVVINDANPRAIQTWEAIERGTKLGISIGAFIPDGGARRDKSTNAILIDHVDLKEASIVGIPANPRSWVEYAVKSLGSDQVSLATLDWSDHMNGTTTTTTNTITITEASTCPTCGGSKGNPKNGCQNNYHQKSIDELDLVESHGELPDSAFACISPGGKKVDGKTRPLSLRHYPHHTASGGVDEKLLRSALSRIGDPSNEQCGKAHLRAHAKALGMGGKGIEVEDFDIVEAVDDDFDTGHFDVPDLPETNATVSIRIDTDSKVGTPDSQGAPSSAPENGTGLLDETADGDDARLGDTVTRSFSELKDMLLSTTRELVALRAQIAEATETKTAAEKARDTAREERDRVLVETKQLIDRFANTPLVRRAALREANEDFSRLAGIYGDDFLKMLEKSE